MITIRKKTQRTVDGKFKNVWEASYFDRSRNRRRKTFPTQKTAKAWLESEILLKIHTPRSVSGQHSSMDNGDNIEHRLARIEAHLMAMRAELDAITYTLENYKPKFPETTKLFLRLGKQIRKLEILSNDPQT